MSTDDNDSGHYRVCPDCGDEAPADAVFCAACGHPFHTSPDDD